MSRSVPLLCVALTLAGCGSKWVANQIVDTSETELAWFRDVDQDGWGSAELPGIEDVEPNIDDGFTAQNNRDCDDSTAEVTGHVAPLCPDKLGVDYTAVVHGTSEFVVVKGDSARVSQAFAADVCGAYGWGGALAAFEGPDDFDKIRAAVDAEGDWAAWIGVVGVVDGDPPWVWDPATAAVVGGALTIDAIGFCGSSAAPPVSVDPARNHLVLVKEAGGLCLGHPEDAGYTDGLAYFVCERTQPDVAEFVLYHLPGAAE